MTNEIDEYFDTNWTIPGLAHINRILFVENLPPFRYQTNYDVVLNYFQEQFMKKNAFM